MREVSPAVALAEVCDLHTPVVSYDPCPGEECLLPSSAHGEYDGEVAHFAADGEAVVSEPVCASCVQADESGAYAVAFPCETVQALGIDSVEDFENFSPGPAPSDAEFTFPDFYKVGGVRFDRFPEAKSFQRHHPQLVVEACWVVADGLRTEIVW